MSFGVVRSLLFELCQSIDQSAQPTGPLEAPWCPMAVSFLTVLKKELTLSLSTIDNRELTVNVFRYPRLESVWIPKF